MTTPDFDSSPRSAQLSGERHNQPPRAGLPGVSGRWAIVAVFAFSVTAVGILYVYWKMHIGPFVPLQKAIAEEFEGSRPLVEGGQRKIHKNTPRTFRITMKVDFNPQTDEARASEFAERVIAFTRERFDLSPYEVLEIHLYWPEPEQEIHQWKIERRLTDGVPESP